MTPPQTPPDEAARLEMLRSLHILDEPLEPIFSDYSALASELCGAPISMVSMIDASRQWFAGRVGTDLEETERTVSFCGHAICTPDQLMWVEDALNDERFFDNPLVAGTLGIRFYAGAPLVVNRQAVGALCAISPTPRPYDSRTAALLQRLASLLSERLEKRHKDQVLRRALEVAADAVVQYDDQGIITGWLHGAEAMFGYAPNEALGRSLAIIVPPRFRRAYERGLATRRETGVGPPDQRRELRAIRKDGSEFDIELCLSAWQKAGKHVLMGVVRDISVRKAQDAKLLKAKADAEAANLAKSAFLANMSHEIRTPLNGVLGVADLLASTVLTPYQTELAGIIRTSATQLEGLLRDVLDLARIESSEFVLAAEPFSLERAVLGVVDLSRLKAEEKGLFLRCEIAEEARRTVVGDMVRLKQILTNLLANAIKFTDRGGVNVDVSASDQSYRFVVSDTGIGFEDDQSEAIFSRFRQADETATRRFGGSGLGLAICRDLVTRMGGDMGCSSEPRRGSTFWFEVTLLSAERAVAEAETDASTAHGGFSVLVADDNPTNRRVAHLILEALGATTTCVEDGAEAVAACAGHQFDVILMDMMMPVMDGISAVEALRADEVRRGLYPTPVIMLTANTLPEHIEQCLAAGAQMHLAKPVTAPALVRAIAQVLSHSGSDIEPELRRAG